MVIAILARRDARFPSWLPSIGLVLGVALVLNPIAYAGFAVPCRPAATRVRAQAVAA